MCGCKVGKSCPCASFNHLLIIFTAMMLGTHLELPLCKAGAAGNLFGQSSSGCLFRFPFPSTAYSWAQKPVADFETLLAMQWCQMFTCRMAVAGIYLRSPRVGSTLKLSRNPRGVDFKPRELSPRALYRTRGHDRALPIA